MIRVSGHAIVPLDEGWEIASCAPGSIDVPATLASTPMDWIPCAGPTTAAAALRAVGRWELSGPTRRFDAEDWWYRTSFHAEPSPPDEQTWLSFDGVATIAEVWLNGAPLLSVASMFTAHSVRVDGMLRVDNEIVIRFRALDAELAVRRPRPRWRAPMVENQQIRWFRTTLLGRTPGWSPPAAPVGLWREVRLERRRGVAVSELRMRADADGRFTLACRIESIDGEPFDDVVAVLERGDRAYRFELGTGPHADTFEGGGIVPDVSLWWPHTHGEPSLYTVRLEILGGRTLVTADLGRVGFRSITLDTRDDAFALRVNGRSVFCRGACWTPLDPVSLKNEDAALEQAFELAVLSGMNMLRVSGPMVYENDAFLDQCDARGILLWQDFMFANLDYPEDERFSESVATEARQLLARLQGRPSIAVLCGDSEGEQQAAMWGAPRERWESTRSRHLLSDLAASLLPDVPYWPSSAHGGAFPHQPNVGTSSYYGVGAYLRPLEDARRAEVRFASECLAFANVPSAEVLARVSGNAIRVNDAAWKSRSPRDATAGWDFDDVRDHYLRMLFGVDPAMLRYSDQDRYLELSRVATGEVMAAAFVEWRRRRSVTGGALIWFLQDLWPGAGWGVIDSDGEPKAAWYLMRRALAPLALALTDEGCGGLAVHLINESQHRFTGTLECSRIRQGDVLLEAVSRPVVLESASTIELNAASFFNAFHDLNDAFRFGPRAHDIVHCTLRDSDGVPNAESFHFVGGLPSGRELDVGLDAEATRMENGSVSLSVRTRRFAQSIGLELPGFRPMDCHFHLAPNATRTVLLHPVRGSAVGGRGSVFALNSERRATIRWSNVP